MHQKARRRSSLNFSLTGVTPQASQMRMVLMLHTYMFARTHPILLHLHANAAVAQEWTALNRNRRCCAPRHVCIDTARTKGLRKSPTMKVPSPLQFIVVDICFLNSFKTSATKTTANMLLSFWVFLLCTQLNAGVVWTNPCKSCSQ